MYYLRNLRVQLQERRNRLYKCRYATYGAEIDYLIQFVRKNHYLSSILETLPSEAGVSFDEWKSSQVNQRRAVEFPNTEAGRAWVCYSIIVECLNDSEGQAWHRWGRLFSDETQFNAMNRDFTESVVDPFVNYLHDRIDDARNVLYLLERFKQRTEWFGQEQAYALYRQDTKTGEASLDRELRASLFDGGVDYPFSQASSPSGRADAVALLETNDPLVLEIKIFDPDTDKDKGNLRQGFHQVMRYANDYNKSTGYLVIFNCSSRSLLIESENDAGREFPPRIQFAGKTVFVISIDINPNIDPASKEEPRLRIHVSVQELIDP